MRYQSTGARKIIFLLILFLLIACNLFVEPGRLTPVPVGQQSPTPTDASAMATAILPTELPPQPNAPTVTPLPTATPLPPAEPTVTPTPASIRFAVIGDYGQGTQPEQDVANLVKSWKPDFVITVGDNNYPSGAVETIDQHVGQYYHEFIFPYIGAYGAGADRLRFFPTLGNHDWDTDRAKAYFDYFVLPGNERYYDFVWGSAHFFALDSDSREPDGVGASTAQAGWLKDKLAVSTSTWNLVYMHHPPFSSGLHGSVEWMRWPFKVWGATAVLSGHDHVYERLSIDGLTYFIDGVGGGPIYHFVGAYQGSQVQFNADYGAMLVTADSQQITFQFITRKGKVIDMFQIKATK